MQLQLPLIRTPQIPDQTQSLSMSCGNINLPTDVLYVPSGVPQDAYMHMTLQESWNIEQSTRKQSESPQWMEERKKRITSSNFHLVAKRKKEVTPAFLNALFNPKPFTSVYTSYGTSTEKEAKTVYLAKHPNLHLHDCGLVVNPNFPFLGASPDAKVCVSEDNTVGVLEVKCPHKARDITISEAVETIKDFCLQRENHGYSLKKTHAYNYQVQGQLMVTGAVFCDFFVYTKKDSVTIRIQPDTEFMTSMMAALSKFYLCQMTKGNPT